MSVTLERSNAKSERIEARVEPTIKDYIARAAQLRGESVTNFVTQAAYDKAVETIRTQNAIELSNRDQECFVNALLSPPPASARLIAAASRAKALFRE